MRYYNNCVGWNSRDVPALIDMIDNSIDVARGTFVKHVDKSELSSIESNLGYSHHWKQGLTMSQDWHVGYYRSKLHGETVYFFKHSGIEYVFKEEAA